MTQRLTLKVFLASPSDVQDAREEAVRQLQSLNSDPEIVAHYQLELLRWETAPPVVGSGPQETINCHAGRPSDADILICVIGRRLGTETEVAGDAYRRAGTRVRSKAATLSECHF